MQTNRRCVRFFKTQLCCTNWSLIKWSCGGERSMQLAWYSFDYYEPAIIMSNITRHLFEYYHYYETISLKTILHRIEYESKWKRWRLNEVYNFNILMFGKKIMYSNVCWFAHIPTAIKMIATSLIFTRSISW